MNWYQSTHKITFLYALSIQNLWLKNCRYGVKLSNKPKYNQCRLKAIIDHYVMEDEWTGKVTCLIINTLTRDFRSLELNAQVSLFKRNVSVVCPCCRKLFTFSISSPKPGGGGSSSAKLGAKHPYVIIIQVYLNEGPHPFLTGNILIYNEPALYS